MARFKDIDGVKTGNLFRVPPELLKVDPDFNIRMDDEDRESRIESYAQMIIAGRRPPPLLVYLRGEDIVVIDGHMRREAALRAIERGHPVQSLDVVQQEGNAADRVVTMLNSGDGRSWTPIELMEGYRRLESFGFSTNEIARIRGKTDQHVRDILDLAKAPPAIHEMVRSGKVSSTTALKVFREEGDLAVETLEKAFDVAQAKGKDKASGKHVKEVKAQNGGEDDDAVETADSQTSALPSDDDEVIDGGQVIDGGDDQDGQDAIDGDDEVIDGGVVADEAEIAPPPAPTERAPVQAGVAQDVTNGHRVEVTHTPLAVVLQNMVAAIQEFVADRGIDEAALADMDITLPGGIALDLLQAVRGRGV